MARHPLQGHRGGGLVSAARRVGLALALASVALVGTGCAMDGLVARLSEDEPPDLPPAVPSNSLELRLAAGLAGAQVQLFSPAAGPLGELQRVPQDGTLRFEFPGSESFENLILRIQQGQRVLLGLLPPLQRLESVYEPGQSVSAAEVEAFGGPINELTTARLLVLLEATRLQPGLTLGSIHPKLLAASLAQLGTPEGRGEALIQWETDFNRMYLLADAESSGPALLSSDELALNPEFLSSLGWADQALEKLGRAAAAVEFARCYAPDTLRVVFSVEMKDGMLDGACRPINRFMWAKDGPGKQMYLTGGVHGDYEGLGDQEQAEVSELLRSWTPNLLAMYDDGSHGDLEANDGIWTVAVDFPRLDPPLQLGYKYTWGLAGAGWTETEEWPGNRRLLELVDNNGDGMVIVLDRFGDEASNKDKANNHPGGRAGVSWSTDVDEDGWPEAQEAPADLDGDCSPDAWPAASAGPLLGDPDLPDGCFP